TRLITTTLGTFSSFLGDAVLVLLFLMFMLGGSESLKTRLRRSLAPDHASSFLRIYTAIDGRIQRYVVIKTAMSLATALLAGAILALGGFDFVLLSALLVFFFNFIPTFGSVVGTVFPVLIGFLQYGLCWRVGIVLLGLMAMQFTMGNVVEPKITGRRLNLSPVVILASLLFWGWLWGMVGMVLSVPLTSVVKIGLEQIPSLRPVAAVLGGGGGFSERTP
ncbi:MAG TPA: AI-2E family transporter, partial [Candidatus Aminicenantes bacterium]|nr:AI-2E family transporter [Candidatus Aminicenantes bacterium]